MALNDERYQLNALAKRVAFLETQSKASPAKAIPYAPQTAATSIGAGIVGSGLGQDAVSRSIQSALTASLTGYESLVDAAGLRNAINFGAGGGPFTVYATNYVRPDPIQGDIFRLTAFGDVLNTSGTNSLISLSILVGGANQTLSADTVNTGTTTQFYLRVVFAVTTAGATGAVNIGALTTYADNVAAGTPANVSSQQLMENTLAGCNLLGPIIAVQAQSGFVSANIILGLNLYSLERVGTKAFATP